MLCEICSSPAPAGARGRKPRFCSGRCRLAAHRRKKFPTELIELPRWIRHQEKRPMTTWGTWASSTNPQTWSDFETAKQSDCGTGLGFVLNGDGIICIDLDHCVENRKPNPQAQALIDSLPKTFIEISPSGTGLHIWGRAKIDKGFRFNVDGLNVEIYPNGRFLTMTGNVFQTGNLAELDLNPLIARGATLNA